MELTPKEIACPRCGQSLAADHTDLQKNIRCSRCRTVFNLGTVVPLSTPIPAQATISPADWTPPPVLEPALVVDSRSDPDPYGSAKTIRLEPGIPAAAAPPHDVADGRFVSGKDMPKFGALMDLGVHTGKAMQGRWLVPVVALSAGTFLAGTFESMRVPHVALAAMLVLSICLLVFTKVAELRRGSATWWTAAWVRFVDAAAALVDDVRLFFESSRAYQARLVGRLLLVGGIFALGAFDVAHLISIDVPRWSTDLALVAVAIGTLLILRARRGSRGTLRLTPQTAADTRNDGELLVHSKQLAETAKHYQVDDFGKLLLVLRDWKPRRRRGEAKWEKEYQEDLERHFKRQNWAYEREVQVGGDKADFVIGDQVVLEMKRGRFKADAAVGQVLRYMQRWPTRRFLLVIVEGRDSQARHYLQQALSTLSKQAPVLGVWFD